jgi:hypothetical protein
MLLQLTAVLLFSCFCRYYSFVTALLLQLTAVLLFACFCLYYSLVTALNEFCHSYIATEQTWPTVNTYNMVAISSQSVGALIGLTENTSHGLCPLLCDVSTDTENTASSIVACWTVFTELLCGNMLIKSVTILFIIKTLAYGKQ